MKEREKELDLSHSLLPVIKAEHLIAPLIDVYAAPVTRYC